jgi:hypothetical protein
MKHDVVVANMSPNQPLQIRQIASLFSPTSPAFSFSSNQPNSQKYNPMRSSMEKSPRPRLKMNKANPPPVAIAGGQSLPP